MLIEYRPWSPSAESLRIVQVANQIIIEYQRQDITITLRALYYRFVSRFPLLLDPSGEHPNVLGNYKKLGRVLNRARLGGLVSWEAMEDRTRNLINRDGWHTGIEFLRDSPAWYHYPMWDNQPNWVEVWLEKDAGIGTVENLCRRNDVPLFSCRGNPSASELWAAAQRLQEKADRGQQPVVLYAGDHDPTGVDITRDVADRLQEFLGDMVIVDRVLLELDQVNQYQPPPNPTKESDSRSVGYRQMMIDADQDPDTCWEMDALDPSVIVQLFGDRIDSYRDDDLWQEAFDKLQERKAAVGRMVRSLGEGDEAAGYQYGD